MPNAACQSFDRGCGGASAFVVDALSSCAVFLVGDFEGSLSGSEEQGKRGSRGDGALGVAKGDVPNPELHCAFSGGLARVGVFSNPKKVIESRAGKIGDSLLFELAMGELLAEQEMGYCYGNGKFCLRGRILSAVSFNLAFQCFPIALACLASVCGVGLSSQFEGRSDGA